EIDVRCVADAEYFCDYDLKYTKNHTALIMHKPDIKSNIPIKGSVKCPDSHPFFVIRGRLPVRNAEIKCENHFGKMRWTFNETILSSTGPDVHCVDKLECHVMNKIAKSNLKGSFLNEHFLPTCQDRGKLHNARGYFRVKEKNTAKVDVVSVKCDRDTGLYNYVDVTGSHKHPVSAQTIFSC
ncbi:hypothetical protein PFISCL1PPCAC_852, partial [Pristionchus fissidentatus]